MTEGDIKNAPKGLPMISKIFYETPQKPTMDEKLLLKSLVKAYPILAYTCLDHRLKPTGWALALSISESFLNEPEVPIESQTTKKSD